MTHPQLLSFLQDSGFTANELFFIIAYQLPVPLNKITAKQLRPMVRIWKNEFKAMKRWREVLDAQQKKEDDKN